MDSTSVMPRASAAAVLASLLALSGMAKASGISVAQFGAEHGNPMTTEPTAIFYNPAGLAGSHGGQVMGDMTLLWRHVTYEHTTPDAVTLPGSEGANTGKASLLNLLALPFVGASYRIHNFAFGAAIYIPYGGQSGWEKNDAFRNNPQFPGPYDGVQRWYSISGEIRSAYGSLAGAYELGPFAVGLSASLIQTKVNTLRARDPTGGDDLRNEGRSWLDVSSWDFGLGAGITYEPVPRVVRIGLSYQSRPNVAGSIRAGGHLRTIFANGKQDSNEVDFLTTLPDVIRLGVSYRMRDNFELRLFGDFQTWANLKDHCVVRKGTDCTLNPDGSPAPGSGAVLNQRRDWQDTFAVRAGASFWPVPSMELVAGVGYSSSAVPASTQEPALPDFNALQAALGGILRPMDSLQLAATYTQYIWFSRDTTGESIHPTLAPPSKSPDSGGKYSQQVGALNLNAILSF